MSISSMMLNSRAHDRRALFPCARSFRAPPAFPPPGPPLSGSRSRAPRAAFRAGGRARPPPEGPAIFPLAPAPRPAAPRPARPRPAPPRPAPPRPAPSPRPRPPGPRLPSTPPPGQTNAHPRPRPRPPPRAPAFSFPEGGPLARGPGTAG